MAKVPKGRGFVLHLPVLGVADRKTLWHKGLPASLRTAALPRTKQPILLLFTDRSLARRYIRARSLSGSAAISLEPASLLRAVLVELLETGVRQAAIDHPTAAGHAWRPVALATIIAAIDEKLPPFAERFEP
ncbi:MAG TPA: hypothetical protein VKE40_10265 [Gemmataceae bacterium]|nr:hypothetical protein [Gemmataceae bacterium]